MSQSSSRVGSPTAPRSRKCLPVWRRVYIGSLQHETAQNVKAGIGLRDFQTTSRATVHGIRPQRSAAKSLVLTEDEDAKPPQQTKKYQALKAGRLCARDESCMVKTTGAVHNSRASKAVLQVDRDFKRLMQASAIFCTSVELPSNIL